MLRVDIGCGTNKPENFLGVDIYPAPGVDIVADISKNFPFNDSSVDELRAYDVIEHLPDRINTMNEIWRVCKAGATVDISVPSTDGRGAFQDPTHISFWNINSFFYYCVEYPIYLELCQRYGFKGAFQIIKLEHENSSREIIHVKAKLKVIKPVPNLQKKDKNNESIRGDNFQKTTELPSQIQAKSQNQQLLDRLFYCSQRYQQDPDHHSAAVDVTHPETDDLRDPQPGGIGRSERRPRLQARHGLEEPHDLVGVQHDRQAPWLVHAGNALGNLRHAERDAAEEPERRDRLIDARPPARA